MLVTRTASRPRPPTRTRPRRPSPTGSFSEAMTEFLKEQLEVYFIENNTGEADKIAEQVLINKRSREHGGKGAPQHQKEAAPATSISQTACRSSSTAARRTLRAASCTSSRATPRSAPVKQGRDSGVSGDHARARQDPELPEGGLRQDLQERHHYRPAQGHRLRRRGARQGGEGSVGVRPRQPAVAPMSSSAPMPMWTASRSAR